MTRVSEARPISSSGRALRAAVVVFVLAVSLAAPGTSLASPVIASPVIASSTGAVAAAGLPGKLATKPQASPVCPPPARGRASCDALLRTDLPASPSLAVVASAARAAAASAGSTAPSAGGAAPAVSATAIYYPADLQSAYGLTAAASLAGTGMTVAIADAYDDPTAEADLAVYRSQFALPACTTASGCFRKVNQSGKAAPLPAADAGWSYEISLDLDMVSAICPNCSILLVEANSPLSTDLAAAVRTAFGAGAKYISNSYGAPEDPSETTLDASYAHAGVVVTASTGDFGYKGYEAGTGETGNQYPSVSPSVVAVGGTRLVTAANARGWSESAWTDGGSGCSLYEPRPAWQPAPLTGCPKRMVADVSAVADPDTGVAVRYSGGWYEMGGTSAAAPIVAAAYALAGPPAAGSWPVSYLYGRGGLNDAVGGSNALGGRCSPDPVRWCTGVVGYDGPTGLGTPNGLLPFTPPIVPRPPTSVTASPENASVLVSWTAPASDGGSPLTGYTATAAPSGQTCAAVPPATSCTVTGLSNGSAYTFTVTATNMVGTSVPSDPSASVTPRTVPGPPQNVAGTPGDRSVALTWAAPVSNGGSVLTGYTATAAPGGHTCVVAPPATSCTVTGLTNGVAYTFTVQAANAAGTGPASAASARVTPRTTPGAPTAVAALPGNGAAEVSWGAPADNGGSIVTGYTVTSAPDGATCAWTSGPLACTVSGLGNGTPYTFTVRATNVAGTGPASTPSPPVTPVALPGPPTGVAAVVPVDTAGPVAAALDVSWAAPADDGGSPLTGYAATAYLAGTLTSTGHGCMVAGNPPATGCRISGLARGVAVEVRVAASTSLGSGLQSVRSAPVTPPSAPSARVAALPTWVLGSFSVSWAGTPGTLPIDHYVVAYRRAAWNAAFGASATWTTAATAAGAPFTPTAGTTYCFRAIAYDTLGFASAWSAESCTAAPLDDRSLARRAGWSSGTGSAYYRGTWVRSSAYGSSLVRTGVKARRLSIVATTCRTCGSVRVYLGSSLLRTVSLYSSTTQYRRVIAVTVFPTLRSGTVTLKVSTSGHTVIIDGLGVSRS